MTEDGRLQPSRNHTILTAIQGRFSSPAPRPYAQRRVKQANHQTMPSQCPKPGAMRWRSAVTWYSSVCNSRWAKFHRRQAAVCIRRGRSRLCWGGIRGRRRMSCRPWDCPGISARHAAWDWCGIGEAADTCDGYPRECRAGRLVEFASGRVVAHAIALPMGKAVVESSAGVGKS